MIEREPGAIELLTVGQEFIGACRIVGCLWVGPTTSGDEVLLKGRGLSATKTMWAARTDVSNTYLGAIWGPPGIHAPDGFRVTALPAGRLLVYLSQ